MAKKTWMITADGDATEYSFVEADTAEEAREAYDAGEADHSHTDTNTHVTSVTEHHGDDAWNS